MNKLLLERNVKMKKTIICSLPFKPNIQKVVYEDTGMPLPTANHAVRFPINAVLDANLCDGDEVKMILLIKTDKNNFYEENKGLFLEELKDAIGNRHVNVTTEIVYTDFSEKQEVHEKLLGDIIDKIDDESHIIADITYGPKDIPILIFAALNFCEKHLSCKIDGIVYGLAQFGDNHNIVEGKMCDMSSLFYLNSISETVQCGSSDKARQLLKTLLSF